MNVFKKMDQLIEERENWDKTNLHLIKEQMNHAPDSSKEYVLVFDHPPDGPSSKVLATQDTVVTNVHLVSEGLAVLGSEMLEFTIKATGQVFHTFYGYMFAENTPDNLERLKKSREARANYFKAKEEMANAFKKVDRIDGPFEGCKFRRGPTKKKVKSGVKDG